MSFLEKIILRIKYFVAAIIIIIAAFLINVAKVENGLDFLSFIQPILFIAGIILMVWLLTEKIDE